MTTPDVEKAGSVIDESERRLRELGYRQVSRSKHSYTPPIADIKMIAHTGIKARIDVL